MTMRAGRLERQSERRDDLLAALRSALRPEPLPAVLQQRIQADFEGRRVPRRRVGRLGFHLAWLAAAACLTAAFVLPPHHSADSPRSARLDGLSPEEAAEIVLAFETVSWDSPLDYTLEAVHSSLEDLSRTLQPASDDASRLPWCDEEDWDVPPPTEPQPDDPRSWVPPRAASLAAIGAGDGNAGRPNESV